jgi:hypothetical protein
MLVSEGESYGPRLENLVAKQRPAGHKERA